MSAKRPRAACSEGEAVRFKSSERRACRWGECRPWPRPEGCVVLVLRECTRAEGVLFSKSLRGQQDAAALLLIIPYVGPWCRPPASVRLLSSRHRDAVCFLAPAWAAGGSGQ